MKQPHPQPQKKYLHPEKYRECGLTVGLCSCVQENKGNPGKDCEYCYGTGVAVYTNIDLPVPHNCPHWINDDIYVKGFRCSLYRDTHTPAAPATSNNFPTVNRREDGELTLVYDYGSLIGHDAATRKAEREQVLDKLRQKILSKMLPKSHQWEAGMYIQYDDVLSMIESLRGGGA